MYRCQVPYCNVNVPGNTPALRIVVESREKEYPARENANKIRISGKKKPILKSDRGGVGSEIIDGSRSEDLLVTLTGGTIIFASTVYIAYRESRVGGVKVTSEGLRERE